MSQSAGHTAQGGEAPAVSRRARMVDSVADLCAAAPRNRTPEADAALAQAFLTVFTDAELDVRAQVARRIAFADWAPRGVAATLALDEIDVARPLLAHSAQLLDPDLLRVLQEAPVDHRVEVARRPALSIPVSDRVSQDEEALVLTALSANEQTTLSTLALGRLVTAARNVSALRGPLARRADLTPDLAQSLHAVVGEGLRGDLSRRFQLPSSGAGPIARGADDQADMERRLVQKLRASGELRPGFLLKSLRDGRLGLFEAALAVLADVPAQGVREAVAGPGPERLALACTAAGLDRSVFPTLLALVRAETFGEPADTPSSMLKVRSALAGTDPQAARRLFLNGGSA